MAIREEIPGNYEPISKLPDNETLSLWERAAEGRVKERGFAIVPIQALTPTLSQRERENHCMIISRSLVLR